MRAEQLAQNEYPKKWIRVPAKGQCPHTGLTRPYFYDLIAKGAIRSSCIKKPGALRGVRLIWLPSVLSYIEKHAEGAGQ